MQIIISIDTVKVELVMPKTWRHRRRFEVQTQSFLTSALDEDEQSASHPGRFIPDKRTVTIDSIGGRRASETIWNILRRENPLLLPGIEPSILNRVA
jgi:hypothetical protein